MSRTLADDLSTLLLAQDAEEKTNSHDYSSLERVPQKAIIICRDERHAISIEKQLSEMLMRRKDVVTLPIAQLSKLKMYVNSRDVVVDNYAYIGIIHECIRALTKNADAIERLEIENIALKAKLYGQA